MKQDLVGKAGSEAFPDGVVLSATGFRRNVLWGCLGVFLLLSHIFTDVCALRFSSRAHICFSLVHSSDASHLHPNIQIGVLHSDFSHSPPAGTQIQGLARSNLGPTITCPPREQRSPHGAASDARSAPRLSTGGPGRAAARQQWQRQWRRRRSEQRAEVQAQHFERGTRVVH